MKLPVSLFSNQKSGYYQGGYADLRRTGTRRQGNVHSQIRRLSDAEGDLDLCDPKDNDPPSIKENRASQMTLIGGEFCEVHEAWLILMLQNLTYRLFDEDVLELNELFIEINIFI